MTRSIVVGLISFSVRFGDPANANDPLPFSQQVSVSCGPMDRIDRILCQERPDDG